MTIKTIPFFLLAWLTLPGIQSLAQNDMEFLKSLTSDVVDSSRIHPDEGFSGINSFDDLRKRKYTSGSAAHALKWQTDLRQELLKLLNLDQIIQTKSEIPFNTKIIKEEDHKDYILKEIEFNSSNTRRIKVILTVPKNAQGPYPAVVCIHGHGGKERTVYETNSIYRGFADELASDKYVTIAGFVSQHEVYEEGMLLMGERLLDLIRCVDFLESMTEVDPNRIGCAGLSLGGEMAMWLGAMDTRIQATVSAGFLTKMDHMEVNHCMCWKFPGLRELVDFADIYALTAPRPLQCQNGLQEPESQFNVPLARQTLKEIEPIYVDYTVKQNLELLVHPEGHVINLLGLRQFFEKHLGDEQ